ncbi:MAG TPA: hypothetical protein VF590_04070, partial [Isosphaeraceae bacterium]
MTADTTWIAEALDLLGRRAPWGYRPGQAAASEPTAWSILALAAHGRAGAIGPGVHWLESIQAADGSVGVTADVPSTRWPTGLAVLAWLAAARNDPGGSGPAARVERAVAWILETRGIAVDNTAGIFGHDTGLQGWPWVEGSHSWIEPTAINLLALKATGRARHPRAREAVALLVDRLLPGGGCNYGNTTVMHQVLRPQIEPTGLALLALAGEESADARIGRSVAYLNRTLSAQTPSTSLGYGLMALSAWADPPAESGAWLEAAFRRVAAGEGGPRTLHLALLALAALGRRGPLVA